jgi:hypothetical protein
MRETAPGKEHAAGNRRMLLLGGLSGAVLIAAALILATMLGGGAPVEGPGALGSDSGVSPGSSPQSQDSNLGVGVIGSSQDPKILGVETACAMFLDGATVDDFAVWFEADIGAVGPAEEDLFHAIVLEALTEECPEVIDSRG